MKTNIKFSKKFLTDKFIIGTEWLSEAKFMESKNHPDKNLSQG